MQHDRVGQESDRVRWEPIVPRPEQPEYLSKGKLRRALVMTCIRHGSVTPVEALAYLLARGFVIESARSLEVVRKALKAEAKGVRDRGPSLMKSPDNTYTYRKGSLTDRTLKRWRIQFPTV